MATIEELFGFTGEDYEDAPRACMVCAEDKPGAMFPDQLPSPLCTHSINTCTDCTRYSITYAVQNTEQEKHSPNQYTITCPECPHVISLDVAQLYVDTATMKMFEEAAMRRVLNLASETKTIQIAWCPFCPNHGQTYNTSQTIAVCLSCSGLFCCGHARLGLDRAIPWHPEHTCEEYDRSVRDAAFRSAAQIQKAIQDERDNHSRELRHQIEVAAEQWELSLTRKDDEARLRKIEKARIERERRDEEERIQRRKARQEVERKAAREAEARQGEDTVNRQFMRCPFCKKPVERISGCSHITCPCGKHWDYNTGKLYAAGAYR